MALRPQALHTLAVSVSSTVTLGVLNSKVYVYSTKDRRATPTSQLPAKHEAVLEEQECGITLCLFVVLLSDVQRPTFHACLKVYT
jgi:hypothetical protein